MVLDRDCELRGEDILRVESIPSTNVIVTLHPSPSQVE